jgi:hypothetical protein
MLANRTRVLLTLSGDVLDDARVLAGKLTTALKLPVSLQIVLRALIEEGLKRPDDQALHANIDRQTRAVREIRSVIRRRAGPTAPDGPERSTTRQSRESEVRRGRRT